MRPIPSCPMPTATIPTSSERLALSAADPELAPAITPRLNVSSNNSPSPTVSGRDWRFAAKISLLQSAPMTWLRQRPYLLHHRTRRRADHEPLVHVVFLQIRVERHPDLRSRLADRRDQDVEGPLRDGLPFFHPDNIGTLEAFDLRDIVPQSRENELRAIGARNRRFSHGVNRGKPQLFNLFCQQPVYALAKRILKLAHTQNAPRFLRAEEQQRARTPPTPPRPPPAVSDFVPRGGEQTGEFDRQHAGGKRYRIVVPARAAAPCRQVGAKRASFPPAAGSSAGGRLPHARHAA